MKAITSPRASAPARAGVATRARVNAATVRELASLFAESGRWWLVPMVVILGLAALLLLLVQLVEYVAPFVYTVF